jgi:hypothetical protein
MNNQSFSDLDNPFAHLAHLPRPERRRQMRAEMKAKQQSLKHQVRVPEPGEYDGMPPETAADCLCDTKARTSNTFRKTCKAARERVIVPTAVKKEGRVERRIAKMNFRQLGKAFRRSYYQRFTFIPRVLARIRGDKPEAEKLRNVLRSALASHDAHIINVNTEITKRVVPQEVVNEARMF